MLLLQTSRSIFLVKGTNFVSQTFSGRVWQLFASIGPANVHVSLSMILQIFFTISTGCCLQIGLFVATHFLITCWYGTS